MVKEEYQDQPAMSEIQDSADQTDHQERSENQELPDKKEHVDHEDHPDRTEITDLKDHQDHVETQDQLWSSIYHPDQNRWHQKDHRGDRLTTSTNSTNTITHTKRRRRKTNRSKSICSISSTDSRSRYLERLNLMEVQNTQLNRAKKSKCASLKRQQETTGWTPTAVLLKMPFLSTATSTASMDWSRLACNLRPPSTSRR